jgi:hypothetical protein
MSKRLITSHESIFENEKGSASEAPFPSSSARRNSILSALVLFVLYMKFIIPRSTIVSGRAEGRRTRTRDELRGAKRNSRCVTKRMTLKLLTYSTVYCSLLYSKGTVQGYFRLKSAKRATRSFLSPFFPFDKDRTGDKNYCITVHCL